MALVRYLVNPDTIVDISSAQVGREYAINPSDLKAVQNRKVGRPRKTKKR